MHRLWRRIRWITITAHPDADRKRNDESGAIPFPVAGTRRKSRAAFGLLATWVVALFITSCVAPTGTSPIMTPTPSVHPTHTPEIPTVNPVVPTPRSATSPTATSPTATSAPPTPTLPATTPTPPPELSREGVRSILVARLTTDALSIVVPFPQVQFVATLEEWDVFSLYWGGGVWEVSGPGLLEAPDGSGQVTWTPGHWWVTEDDLAVSPADGAASTLVGYLTAWREQQPTPTPVPPTSTPTPLPPSPTCDVASEVQPIQILGTMIDPLMLRADIEVALRNTCLIPVLINVIGVVFTPDGTELGRQSHYRAVSIEAGELLDLSILVLGNYSFDSEFTYRVEVTRAAESGIA